MHGDAPATGTKPKEDQTSPRSFNPLESGARGGANDPEPAFPHSHAASAIDIPSSGTSASSLPHSGRLSQVISEHLAHATGGSGRATSAADVSPGDYSPWQTSHSSAAGLAETSMHAEPSRLDAGSHPSSDHPSAVAADHVGASSSRHIGGAAGEASAPVQGTSASEHLGKGQADALGSYSNVHTNPPQQVQSLEAVCLP